MPGRGARAAAVRVAQAPARRGSPGCASSTAARRCGCAARARSSTRCASTSAATTSARSTGGPVGPQPQRRGPHLAARARPARGARARHLARRRPAGSATCPASTRRWTPPCCSPRSPRGPATASTSSPATAGCAARLRLRRGPRRRQPAAGRDGRPRAGDRRGRLDARSPARSSRFGRQRALVVLLTPLEPSAVEEGLLPVLPALTRHHRVVLASVARPRARAAGRGTRDGLDEVYAAAAAEQVLARRRAHRRPARRPRRRRRRRRRRATCRRRSPTTTSRSRRAGCSEGPAQAWVRDPVLEQRRVDVAGLAARTARRPSTNT